MKTFIVVFKNGAKIAVKAEGFAINPSGHIRFQAAAGNAEKDIYVATSEVLYIAAEDSLTVTPNLK